MEQQQSSSTAEVGSSANSPNSAKRLACMGTYILARQYRSTVVLNEDIKCGHWLAELGISEGGKQGTSLFSSPLPSSASSILCLFFISPPFSTPFPVYFTLFPSFPFLHFPSLPKCPLKSSQGIQSQRDPGQSYTRLRSLLYVGPVHR